MHGLHSIRRLLAPASVLLLPILTAIAGSTAARASTAQRQTSPSRLPNVLFIVADDMRPDAIRALGNNQIITPNLDRLVRDGVAFNRAYCRGANHGAVCAASRAMLLTGESYDTLPDQFVRPWAADDGSIEPTTLPQRLGAAGYERFATGKWHQPKAALNRSFDRAESVFFGGMGPHTGLVVHDFDPTGAYPAESSRALETYSSTAFADAFIRFVESRPDDAPPFFAWVSFTAPHDPRTPPDDWRGLYRASEIELPRNFLPEHPFDNGELDVRDEMLLPVPRDGDAVREEIARYYAMISQLDAQVGRMLEALESRGQLADTIVVFVSDHGLALGSHGLLGKQNLYEHSAGAPLLVSGPGIPARVRLNELVYLHDVVPTVLELTGVEQPAAPDVAASPTAGRSFRTPLLNPIGPDRGRSELLLAYRDLQRGLVTREWKLIVYPQSGPNGRVQLFDLVADPFERHDVARQRPKVVAELGGRLVQLMRDADDPLDAAGIGRAIQVTVDPPRDPASVSAPASPLSN